ncbi:MAG: (Fe-S)-binding protein [Desulfobacteraceae bacterium]|nr:(Fe-S)-binding protein [Desulfobacteraceae bacterium]MBC2754313.1 (Fe-S)-binding protein [Desulfobacteraceae bacterium]
MEHEEILHRCFRCGYCKLPGNYVDINCPAYLAFRFETYSPGGRMWLLRAWLDEKISASERFAEIMFSCATCGNCVEHCAFPEFRDRLLLAFTAGKEALLDAGQVPAPVRDYLTKIQLHGNPYGKSVKKSGQWLDGLDVALFSDQEHLFFIDDVGTYDPRGQEIARSVVTLLQKAGISFGIITDAMNSDGNDVKAMGETALFEDLAEKNIKVLNKLNVKKIITLSPHSLNALKNDYPALGGQYQVFHYTQVLAFAMAGLTFSDKEPEAKIAYHDPCYLGRHNTDYESARMILRSVPGVTLVEMDRNRNNALCCGGGGGNFFTDILSGGDETSARVRVREAVDAGAEILAVACPMCAVMLEDAVKAENLDDRIQVLEVSEIVRQRF